MWCFVTVTLFARPFGFFKARTAELFASGDVWIRWKHFHSRYSLTAKKRPHAFPDDAFFYIRATKKITSLIASSRHWGTRRVL
jgi:hypothetical protein